MLSSSKEVYDSLISQLFYHSHFFWVRLERRRGFAKVYLDPLLTLSSMSLVPWRPRCYFGARPLANPIHGGVDLCCANLILIHLCLTNLHLIDLHLIDLLWGWPVTKSTRKKWSHNSQLKKKLTWPILDLCLQPIRTLCLSQAHPPISIGSFWCHLSKIWAKALR